MFRWVILAILVTIATTNSPLDEGLDQAWKDFKMKFNRSYDVLEEGARRYIWEQNVHLVFEHNKEASAGFHTYSMEINKYSDWTIEEWNRKRRCLHRSKDSKRKEGTIDYAINFELPPSVDWRNKSFVTEIKDQGDCGSCWAFSATGSLEGQHKAKTGELVSLSEQNLVDCSRNEGNQGCDGGLMSKAFDYVKQEGGIDSETCYPYTAQDDRCKFKKTCISATCRGYEQLPPGNELKLQAAIAAVGPVSVAICVTDKFMQYKEGVFYDKTCSTSDLDHGVLVVGYGTQKGTDYWIVKNSWGTDWGMRGYILMTRNKRNNCGIASLASYPLM